MQQFLDDKHFFATLIRLWFPLALQQLIIAGLGLVSVTMIGQLGDTAIAAVGLANQIFFLLQLLLFGVGSGSAIYVAQFWGKRDIVSIRRILGVCLTIGLVGAAFFSFIAIIIPDLAVGIYSTDPAVIALGGDYLRIAGLGYIAVAITTSYAVTLRSTGNVRLPVTISILTLLLGTVLNYALIFGAFGLPALGVRGSAIGTMLPRLIECIVLLGAIYTSPSAAAASLRQMFGFDLAFLWSVLKTILPVTLNEILWSTGISLYSVIYAHISTESLAAVSIASTIENLAFVPFAPAANVCAIMIGHRIGADEEHKAFDYARRFFALYILASAIIGSAVFLTADLVLSWYDIAAASQQVARAVLTIISFALFIKVSNMLFIVGILRAGGDTRVSFAIDVGSLWLIGLPLAALGAFVFQLPAYWVYLLGISDEATKFLVASWRILSKRWINNLARQHAPPTIAE